MKDNTKERESGSGGGKNNRRRGTAQVTQRR